MIRTSSCCHFVLVEPRTTLLTTSAFDCRIDMTPHTVQKVQPENLVKVFTPKGTGMGGIFFLPVFFSLLLLLQNCWPMKNRQRLDWSLFGAIFFGAPGVESDRNPDDGDDAMALGNGCASPWNVTVALPWSRRWGFGGTQIELFFRLKRGRNPLTVNPELPKITG